MPKLSHSVTFNVGCAVNANNCVKYTRVGADSDATAKRFGSVEEVGGEGVVENGDVLGTEAHGAAKAFDFLLVG